MQELLLIAVGTAFVNNVVLSQFLESVRPRRLKKCKDSSRNGRRRCFRHYDRIFVTGLIYKLFSAIRILWAVNLTI